MQMDTQYWEAEAECTLYTRPINRATNTAQHSNTMDKTNNVVMAPPPPDNAPSDKLLPSPKDPQTDQSLPTPMDTLLDSDIDIKIIGAAPFTWLIRDGIEVYQLHISPVPPSETLHVEQPQDPEWKKTEQEILEEVVPPEYHNFASIFSEGEAKNLTGGYHFYHINKATAYGSLCISPQSLW